MRQGYFIFLKDQKKVPLTGKEMVIGRPSKEIRPDVVIKDRLVSRKHAVINQDEKGYYLRDFGTNGTRVNGREIEVVYLKHGDRVEVGTTKFKFVLDGQDETERPPKTAVLIADGCADDARLIQDVLSGFDCTCEIVIDGKTAWQRLSTGSFDMLIVDVVVSGIDGFELCRRVRQHPNLQNVSVVMISYMAGAPEVAHGLAQGATDYLGKPVEREKISEKVKGLINKR